MSDETPVPAPEAPAPEAPSEALIDDVPHPLEDGEGVMTILHEELNLNGYTYPRGVEVRVPVNVAENLRARGWATIHEWDARDEQADADRVAEQQAT